jgi:hypothetical protein
VELQAKGENSNTWGTKLNTGFSLLEDAIAGMVTVSTTGGTVTLTTVNGGEDQARYAAVKVTGTLASNVTIVVPNLTKQYLLLNETSGAYTVTIKTAAGNGVTVVQGDSKHVFCDAVDVKAVSASGAFIRDKITPVGGTTVLSTSFTYEVGANAIAVYRNGQKLIVTTDYTETSSTSITLVDASVTGDTFELFGAGSPLPGSFPHADSVKDAQYVEYTAPGTGAVPVGVDTLLDGITNALSYGADPTGATSSATAFTNMKNQAAAAGSIMYVPNGTYDNGSDDFVVDGGFLWMDDGFGTGVDYFSQAENTLILLTAKTPNTSPLSGADSRVPLSVTVEARGAQHADGIRSNLQNYSSDGAGNTAFYGYAASGATAAWSAALHGETYHAAGTSIGVNSETATYSTSGAVYGLVVNQRTATAEATHPLTGDPAVTHPTATAILLQGLNSAGDISAWATGIRVGSLSMRPTGTAVSLECAVANNIVCSGAATEAHLKLTGGASVADILVSGGTGTAVLKVASGTSKGVGLALEEGAFTSGAAIRMGRGQEIAFEATSTISMALASGNDIIQMLDGASEVIGFFVDAATPAIRVNGIKVVGPRIAGYTASSGTSTRTGFDTASVTLEQLAQRVKALIEDLSTHGLIGS